MVSVRVASVRHVYSVGHQWILRLDDSVRWELTRRRGSTASQKRARDRVRVRVRDTVRVRVRVRVRDRDRDRDRGRDLVRNS
eukprot:COSAG03_NODE_19121_length_342_cov_0.930041_2_plen_81_part_01